MKIVVSADMEGATGVTWPADVTPGTGQWQRFRGMLTSDVNAIAEGLFDGGASAVVINEAHSTMRNILLEQLDRRAVMITGRHKDLNMLEGIQHGRVDGVAFAGYHAGAGEEGVLAHTYLPNSVTAVRVNGEPASEGRLNALVAAEYGVPVILVTGDDRACADAARYAPQAQTAVVKECLTRYSALCPPPEVTAVTIRAAAERAMTLAGQQAPAPPQRCEVEIEVDAAQLAQAAAIIPVVTRTGDRTVRYSAASAKDMLRWFRVVVTMIATATEDRYG